MTNRDVLGTVLVLAGCSTPIVGADGGPDGGVITDVEVADAPARPCEPTAPFGPRQLVAGLASLGNDALGSLSPDELTVWLDSGGDRSWASSATSREDIVTATRARTDTAFDTPSLISTLNSLERDQDPAVSADGRLLLFVTTRTGETDVLVSTRPTALATWGAPVPASFTMAGSGYAEADPALSDDAVFFRGCTPPCTESDIFVANRVGASFDAPTRVAAVATTTEDFAPTPSADGSLLFFGSLRSDGGASGSSDIWLSERDPSTGEYLTPTNVSELNTPGEEYPGWLSVDGCRLYFTGRGADGLRDVFVAARGG